MVRLTMCVFGLVASLLNSAQSVARNDAFTELIRGRIEAFSDASSRGDQSGMNSLLDDEVLFSSGSGIVDRDPSRDKSDAIATLLRQQTVAFQDADRRRDATAMKRYLADGALFVNEDGVVSGSNGYRRDPLTAASKDVTSEPKLTDWVLHYSGDVAVASFIGEHTVGAASSAVSHKFLTVETWAKSDTAWKLIASQAIPLYRDPASVILSPRALNDYVGVYTGGPGLSVVISLNGSALAVSTNGSKSLTYEAEKRDVFFMPELPPGTPRSRIVFERDTSGHIAGYVSSRGLELTRSGFIAPQATTAVTQTAITSTVLPAADLVVRSFGDVAVATFIHERLTHYYGQVLHTKFRSTETWIKRGAEWKMLALQSCELDRPLPGLLK